VFDIGDAKRIAIRRVIRCDVLGEFVAGERTRNSEPDSAKRWERCRVCRVSDEICCGAVERSKSSGVGIRPGTGCVGCGALSTLALNPTAVTGGTQSSTGTVTLSGAAPSGGAVCFAFEQQHDGGASTRERDRCSRRDDG